jgi:hypothetical protein
LPVLLNAIMIEINPCGKQFAMLILCSHGFSNVVAWGITSTYHYKAKIVLCQVPAVKNMPQPTKKLPHNGTISVIMTKRVLDEEGRRHSLQKDSCPLAKTPPDMPCIFFCVCRVCRVIPNHRAPLQKYKQFCVNLKQSLGQP